MIKVALFAYNQAEANESIKAGEFDPNEVKFINAESDIDDITSRNTEIVMYGQYYERPQWYTELADKLERKLQNGGERPAKNVSAAPKGGAGKTENTGEPGKTDLPAKRQDRQGQGDGNDGDDTGTAQRPNLPRRKSDETQKEN